VFEDAKAAVECARATRFDAVPVLVLIIKCWQQNFFFFLPRDIVRFILSTLAADFVCESGNLPGR
jgi:hypothetical protein